MKRQITVYKAEGSVIDLLTGKCLDFEEKFFKEGIPQRTLKNLEKLLSFFRKELEEKLGAIPIELKVIEQKVECNISEETLFNSSERVSTLAENVLLLFGKVE